MKNQRAGFKVRTAEEDALARKSWLEDANQLGRSNAVDFFSHV